MLYNENLHEEEQHLIQQIAEQTERGKIGWELTEYNPLSFLNEDKIDKNPAVMVNVVPASGILSAVMVPLWTFTSSFAMERPSPFPLADLDWSH